MSRPRRGGPEPTEANEAPPAGGASAPADTDGSTPGTGLDHPGGHSRGRWWPRVLAAVGLALIWAFVAEPFRIPTESMEPTLRPGDQVLLNKLAYRFGSPHRNDLAVFRSPDGGEISLKRIVGLPGDRIGIEDGVLKVNGHLERESYVDYRFTDSVYFGPITVPAGHVFVMGDNRSNSRDSRVFGAIDEDLIVGRAFVRVWPVTHLGWL